MTETIMTRSARDNRTFGGEIHEGDFWGYNSLAQEASKIRAAQNFDNMCMKFFLNRERYGAKAVNY